MTLGEIIKEYRSKNKMSMQDFAVISGISKQYISCLERNQHPTTKEPIVPSIPIIQKCAKAMHITFDELFNSLNPEQAISLDDISDNISILLSKNPNIMPLPKMHEIPLIGTIACGTPILAEQNIEGYVQAPDHVHADFSLRCQGDSMINARILDGDIVYIRQQPDVDDGEIAAVLIGEDATLKRVYHQSNGVTLVAENPAYSPMVFVGEEAADVRIMGKAVAFLSNVK